MNESRAREEICRVGQSLFARGYAHATAGNISVKLGPDEGGGFLITPTDACMGFLDPARLARLDDEGHQVGGDRASKTIALHRRIYQANLAAGTPVGCVIHTHSTHCVALTLQSGGMVVERGGAARELLPALTPYFVMKVGHVPVVDYFRPGDPAAATEVERLIARYAARGTPIRAVMLDRLGPNVWHKSPAEAMAALEELEETARLWLLNSKGSRPLSDAAIEELREVFAAAW